MEHVITFKPHTSLVSDTSMVQRVVYFALGFGLIVTAMADPPATMTWMAIGNGLGIILVMLGILGKRLLPEMSGSHWIQEPRLITNTIGLLLGVGVSIIAIAQPPVATIWAAYAHFVAIALVTQAIIGYQFLMNKAEVINTGPVTEVGNNDDIVTFYPKVA